MSRRLKILLYVSFGIASLALSLVLTFPFDVLGRLLETEYAKAVPGGAVTINRIGPSLPLGLYLGNVVVEPPGPLNGPQFQVESIRIKPAWMKLLTLKPGVAFAVKALSGAVDGQVWQAGSEQHLDVAANNVHLEDGQLEKLLGVQLQGIVSGHLSAGLVPGPKGAPPGLTDGEIALTIADAHIKGGKVMGFPLPQTDLGAPEVEIKIEKGEAKIEKFKTKSPDIELNITGGASLKANALQSLLRATLKVKLTDEWQARNPTLKGALSLASKFRRSDGSLEVPLNGTLGRPINLPGMGF